MYEWIEIKKKRKERKRIDEIPPSPKHGSIGFIINSIIVQTHISGGKRIIAQARCLVQPFTSASDRSFSFSSLLPTSPMVHHLNIYCVFCLLRLCLLLYLYSAFLILLCFPSHFGWLLCLGLGFVAKYASLRIISIICRTLHWWMIVVNDQWTIDGIAPDFYAFMGVFSSHY